MDKDKKGIEANASVIPPREESVVQTQTVQDDLEAKVKALEAEKARLNEEAANYKVAYLKERSKKGESPEGESEDDKIRRIAHEALSDSRLAEINRELEQTVKKALAENKELKLAQLNKGNTPPAALGIHSEGQPVRDTLVTTDQMADFKKRGWSDKDIERYKKNLQRYSGR